MTAVLSDLCQAARALAEKNHFYEPGIRRTYWFPDPEEKEIRLVHVDENSLGSGDTVLPAYFRATPRNGSGYLSAIALIRPEEDDRSLLLPDGWNWSSATVWDW